MIDTSGLPYAKPRPHLLTKREKRAALTAQDRSERKRCHVRSGGQCEVIIARFRPECSELSYARCRKGASHNHHLIGGIGRRNVGASIFAEHRLDTCSSCHAELTRGILVPLFEDADYKFNAALVRYERRTW